MRSILELKTTGGSVQNFWVILHSFALGPEINGVHSSSPWRLRRGRRRILRDPWFQWAASTPRSREGWGWRTSTCRLGVEVACTFSVSSSVCASSWVLPWGPRWFLLLLRCRRGILREEMKEFYVWLVSALRYTLSNKTLNGVSGTGNLAGLELMVITHASWLQFEERNAALKPSKIRFYVDWRFFWLYSSWSNC